MDTKKVIAMVNFAEEVSSKAREYLLSRAPMPKEWRYEPFTEELKTIQKKCDPLHDDLESLGEKSRGYVYYAVALVIDLEAARNRICNPIVEYRDGEYIDSLGCIITCWLNGTLSSGEENFAELGENLAEMGIDYVTAYDFLRNEDLRESFEAEFVLSAPDEYDYGKDMELDTPFRRPWEADYVNFVKNWDKYCTIAENARWYTESELFTYEEETD